MKIPLREDSPARRTSHNSTNHDARHFCFELRDSLHGALIYTFMEARHGHARRVGAVVRVDVKCHYFLEDKNER